MSRWSLETIADLLDLEQDGVVSLAQIEAAGGTRADVRRLIRQRWLSGVHQRVYVNHTGALTRRQREWAAVLACWPAALAGRSALPGPQGDVVHVTIDASRRLRPIPGVVITRSRQFDLCADPRPRPPRVRIEHALIDVASGRLSKNDILGAFAELSRVTGTRLTTPDRILDALDLRTRVPGRDVLRELVHDLRDGACSVLERGYLRHVERAHALPRGERQVSSIATGGRTYQDVRYRELGLIVELDGASHDTAVARDRDALRDLAELSREDLLTVRVTYGMVFRRPCRTAAMLALVLGRCGWTDQAVSCGDLTCDIGDRGVGTP